MGRRIMAGRIVAGRIMAGRIMRGAVVAATTGIGVMLLTPMAAHAAVTCGQTITASTTLDQDLNCAGTGVVINAPNVVFDLGGHTITGPAPTTVGNGPRGVLVSSNRTGATVRNGIIRGFDIGVDTNPGANGATVTGLVLDTNGLGILVNTGASSNQLTSNTIVNTTHFSGIQLGGNGHLVEGNTFFNDVSIGVYLSGNNDIVRGNTMVDMGLAAITVDAFPNNPGPFLNNQFVDNKISGSARVGSSSSISVNNGSGTKVTGNAVNGRRTTPGVFVLNSANTLVSGNALANNSTGVLVQGTSTGTQVLGNQAGSSVFSGVAIQSGTAGTTVADNVADNNGGNGIDVRSAATTVARNSSNFNGQWGIFAVSGVVDGGGNTATGNGVAAQCTSNISCS